MDNLNSAIIALLSMQRGRNNALGRDHLLARLRGFGLNVTEREMRQAIHDLRRQGHLICSAAGEDGGYYKAASLVEVDDFFLRELDAKIADMSETRKAMKAAARQQFGDAVQVQMI